MPFLYAKDNKKEGEQMEVIVSLAISTLALIATVFFNTKSSNRTDKKDIEARATESIRVEMKLDEIGRNVSEIKDELRQQKQTIQGVIERVAKVEASSKQAHHRLDRMEGKECRDE